MRIRTIKPEFWTDEDLATISEFALMLAIGLLNYADDEGYFNANPQLIKSALFPLREPSRSIHGGLTELSQIGFVELCVGTDGRQYGRVARFAKHQVINRASKSKIALLWVQNTPIHGGLTEDSLNAHGGLTEDSLNAHGGLTEDSLPEKEKEVGKEKEQLPASSKLSPLARDGGVGGRDFSDPPDPVRGQDNTRDPVMVDSIESGSGSPQEVAGMFKLGVLAEEAQEPDGPEERARAKLVQSRLSQQDRNEALGEPLPDETQAARIRRQAQEMREELASRRGA